MFAVLAAVPAVAELLAVAASMPAPFCLAETDGDVRKKRRVRGK